MKRLRFRYRDFVNIALVAFTVGSLWLLLDHRPLLSILSAVGAVVAAFIRGDL